MTTTKMPVNYIVRYEVVGKNGVWLPCRTELFRYPQLAAESAELIKEVYGDKARNVRCLKVETVETEIPS